MTTSLYNIPPFIAKRLRRYEVNGYVFHTVRIEKGSFIMGGADGEARSHEKPVREVTHTEDYEMGIYAVTQGLWRAVMGSAWPKVSFEGDERPVHGVSWEDICASGGFLEQLNTRLTDSGLVGAFNLPTEAQWEYAARGGRYWERAGRLYAGSDRLAEVGWYKDNHGDETQNAGRKWSNMLGLCDMSGNVIEWCRDWYGAYPAGPQTNPSGPDTGSRRVIHGGCWFSGAGFCRVAYRDSLGPGARNADVGFRLVLVP
jgi:formylglycine-generating enzyme required for sulfatase activity